MIYILWSDDTAASSLNWTVYKGTTHSPGHAFMHSGKQGTHEGGGEEKRVALHLYQLLSKNKHQHTVSCVVFLYSTTTEGRAPTAVEALHM